MTEMNPVAMILYAAQNYPDSLEIMPLTLMGKVKRSKKMTKTIDGTLCDLTKPAEAHVALPDEWAKKLINAPDEHMYMMVRIGRAAKEREESLIVLPGEV